jgi:glycine/D-amino acid oxidase-like deaminating enzyme
LGDVITVTRQDVFFFGTPPGDSRFSENNLPVWFEMPRFMYGIPGNERRGFKIADNDRGAAFDPTDGDRRPLAGSLETARECLARRFPALKDAPVVESRVCQYENSPDHHFLVDRHPAASNVWIVGGGSGHGFKHGPAMGELVADTVLEKKPREPLFALSRFQKPKQDGERAQTQVRMV